VRGRVRLLRALLDEGFAFCADGRLGREGDGVRVEHDLLPGDALLAQTLPKGPLPEQHLEKDDAHRPHIHLHHAPIGGYRRTTRRD